MKIFKLLSGFIIALILVFWSNSASWAETKTTPKTTSKEAMTSLRAEYNMLENEHKAWQSTSREMEMEHKWVSKAHLKRHKETGHVHENWMAMEEKHKHFMAQYKDILRRHEELVKEHKAALATYKEETPVTNILDRQQRLQTDYKMIKREHQQMVKTHEYMHHMHESMMHKMHSTHNMNMSNMKSCEGVNCKSCKAGETNCKSCCKSK